jgi:acetyl-CoA carboxylase biotin carboxyl carrier protein
MSWVKRVEAVLDVLKGSSISEIELAEGELEIIIRRSPGNDVAVKAYQHANTQQMHVSASASSSIDVKSSLTGVYYSAPSPTMAAYVNVGDIIEVGQTIALIEAMKVFKHVLSLTLYNLSQ